jgi:hypothetical protein
MGDEIKYRMLFKSIAVAISPFQHSRASCNFHRFPRVVAAFSPICCIQQLFAPYRRAAGSTRRARHGCGCSSGVEHNLAKVGVEGSNPFARSTFPQVIQIVKAGPAGRLLLRKGF